MTKKALTAVVIVAIAAAGLFWLYDGAANDLPPAGQNDPPRVTVRFGMLPYGDHTYAIIGERNGWFNEVGINLDYRPVKVEDTVPFLLNGTLDIGSCSPGIIITAFDNNPGVVNFVFGDIFQGYALMARSDRGYKSVAEFVGEGLALPEAIRAAVRQLRGRTFAFPSEAAIKPFIDLALNAGSVSRSELKELVLDDPLTVNAMRNGQADFQTGGVPSRLVLQREGFKPILTSNDLARTAKPSPDSEELASIFTDGWASTRDYYDKNRDTVLRMASVNFRITKFIQDEPDKALAIHMPYLSQVTGQTFTPAEGRIIYTDLDPFYTFEQQRDWYHDANSVYFHDHLNGAIINSFVRQGFFKAKPPAVRDVSVADEVYRELERLAAQADQHFARLEGEREALSAGRRALFDRAKAYYAAYNYLDAERTARLALDGE